MSEVLNALSEIWRGSGFSLSTNFPVISRVQGGGGERGRSEREVLRHV